MADYLKFIGQGAGLVGLKDDLELITAVFDLATHWPELKTHIDDVASLEDFLTRFIGHVTDPKIKEAFDKTGDPKLVALYGKLAGLLGRLKDAVGDIPEPVKKLLSPMSTFNGPGATGNGAIDWKPIDENRKFGEGGDYSFEIGGSATFSLVAADEIELGAAGKTKLLKIGADLGVHAKAGATPPFQPLKVDGKFKASGDASIAFHFDTGPGDPLYVAALAECLPALPNPFDYDAVWRAFARKKLGFSRLNYAVKGRTKANADLSIGNKASFGDSLVIDLSMTFSADFSLEADYVLTLSAGAALGAGDEETAPREIEASLTRSRLTDEGLAFGLKVELDLSKVAQRIQKEVQKAVDQWDSLLKRVKPFLSPGTLIQTTLSKELGEGVAALIKDAGLREAVTRSLRSVIGVDPGQDQDLIKWLSDQLSGAIDAAEGAITDQTDAAIDRVLERLSDVLPAAAEEAIRAKIKPLVADLLDKAKGKLSELVKDLFDNEKEALRKALKDVGIKAADAVASADKALASVRKVIDNFDKLIHDTVKELKNGARAKISIGLQAEERRQDQTKVELAGAFTANSKEAAKVFHALTRGKLNELRPLLVSDLPGDDFRLDPSKSRLTLYSKRTSTFGWQVLFFGFGASGHIIASGDARVILDGRGTVEVDSKGEIENLFIGKSEKRKVTLVEGFDLIQAKIEGVQTDRKRVLDFGVDIVHEDESLKLGEMRGFISSLDANGLLPTGADVAGRADALFVRWAGSSDKKAHIPADIAAGLHLSAGEVKQLMMLEPGQRDHARLTRASGVTIIEPAIAMLLKTEALPFKEERLRNALAFIRQNFYPAHYPAGATPGEILYDMNEPDEDPAGVLAPSWKAPGRIPPSGLPGRGEDIQYVLKTLRNGLHALVRVIDLMGQIYLAQPVALDEQSPLGWDQNVYTDKQHQLALSGSQWIKTGGVALFWISREVQPWTVTLLSVIAALARVENEPAPTMSLTLTHRGADNVQKETIELTNLE
jgi:hypothetical protein